MEFDGTWNLMSLVHYSFDSDEIMKEKSIFIKYQQFSTWKFAPPLAAKATINKKKIIYVSNFFIFFKNSQRLWKSGFWMEWNPYPMGFCPEILSEHFSKNDCNIAKCETKSFISVPNVLWKLVTEEPIIGIIPPTSFIRVFTYLVFNLW